MSIQITDDLLAELEQVAADSFHANLMLQLDSRKRAAEVLPALVARIRALEKDADRYRLLSKVTPYRFKKLQELATTDGGDVLYFHRDRLDAAIDAALQGEQS